MVVVAGGRFLVADQSLISFATPDIVQVTWRDSTQVVDVATPSAAGAPGGVAIRLEMMVPTAGSPSSKCSISPGIATVTTATVTHWPVGLLGSALSVFVYWTA